jgi:oxygen-dependent protoporphyrinogen oxidase
MSLALRREQVPHPLDGFGFVVPVIEERTLIAATFSSVKFPGRAPEGWVLMRAFLGGAMHAKVYEMNDDDLRAGVLRDLRELVGVQGEPHFTELSRWPRSMPQYPVGHLDRVKRIQERLSDLPGLAVAGNAYGGVGVPDCVHSAEMAAESLLAHSLAS